MSEIKKRGSARRKRRQRARRRKRIAIAGALSCLAALIAAVMLVPKGSEGQAILSVADAEGVSYDVSMEADIMEAYRRICTIAASAENSAWIEDGRVTVAGSNEFGQCETGDWQNVVAVALGQRHVMGLTAEGALLFAGNNDFGQCNLDPAGAKVVSIAASAMASYAVLEDGRVIVSGSNIISNTEFADARNVAVVAASDSHVALLKKDGTVVAYGSGEACRTGDWKNIVMLACGQNVTAALDGGGIVHVAGGATYGQNRLDGTSDAAAVAAGGNFCLVVLKDGSVTGDGSNSRGQLDVAGWSEIDSAACGYMHAIALTADGKRVFSGRNDDGQWG